MQESRKAGKKQRNQEIKRKEREKKPASKEERNKAKKTQQE